MMAVQREGTTAKRARQIPGAGFRPDIIVGSI
jgi:hypothetical protein